MPLLLEILGPETGTTFVDDTAFEWISDAEFVFADLDQSLRLSTENFAGYRYWSGDILEMDPIAFKMDTAYGGAVRLTGAGRVTIAMSAFDSVDWWFTRYVHTCQLSYTDTTEDAAVVLLDGTLFMDSIEAPLSFGFTLFPKDNDVDMLSTATDYDGNTVVLPLALGFVQYVRPVRLPDAGGGNQRYSAGGLTGTKHVDWHVFDDGIDVCTNATAISDNVFELSVLPVGEITISKDTVAPSTADWLVNILTTICGASYLNLVLVHDLSYAQGNQGITKWVDSQISAIELLSQIAVATDCFFYILSDTVYFHSNSTTYYDTLSLDVETDTLDGTRFEYRQPVAIIRHNWKFRQSVAETIGQYVKEIDKEESVTTAYPYGQDITVDCYTETPSIANDRLDQMLLTYVQPQIFCKLPAQTTLIRPGTMFTLTDNRFDGRVITADSCHVQSVTWDFMDKTIEIEGSGVITTS